MENKEEKKPFDLRGESKEFAIRSIKLYQYLTEKSQKKEYNLSKQFLIAGTRIGDLVRQENRLEAFHAASSAKYWLELLLSGEYLTPGQVESMQSEADRLVRYLYVISHPESRKDATAPDSRKDATVPEESSSVQATAIPSSFAAGKVQEGGAQ